MVITLLDGRGVIRQLKLVITASNEHFPYAGLHVFITFVFGLHDDRIFPIIHELFTNTLCGKFPEDAAEKKLRKERQRIAHIEGD
jgi:hypothetical protein